MNKRVLLWPLQIRVHMRTRLLGLLVSILLPFYVPESSCVIPL